jgi:transposase-like protein
MSKREPRIFSREFKLKAVARLEAGESGTALARELAAKRTVLYRWRDAFRAGGARALRSQRGRPPKAEALRRRPEAELMRGFWPNRSEAGFLDAVRGATNSG